MPSPVQSNRKLRFLKMSRTVPAVLRRRDLPACPAVTSQLSSCLPPRPRPARPAGGSGLPSPFSSAWARLRIGQEDGLLRLGEWHESSDSWPDGQTRHAVVGVHRSVIKSGYKGPYSAGAEWRRNHGRRTRTGDDRRRPRGGAERPVGVPHGLRRPGVRRRGERRGRRRCANARSSGPTWSSWTW